ncbi:hypothetical protein ABZ858_11570 [Streptomyces sp. NPDC047017]|uniref:hypothetical protein n=1 Tax=Streptomyces sp. NPDC047017 TaxID=3155024 RepID=UPI003401B2D3
MARTAEIVESSSVEIRFDHWPVVTLAVGGGESPAVVRDAVLDALRSALARERPFAAVLDMTAATEAEETGSGPGGRDSGGRDPRTAEHARAVKELRAALAVRCRGLAFVGGRALAPEAAARFWGCPVARWERHEDAMSWARESLA